MRQMTDSPRCAKLNPSSQGVASTLNSDGLSLRRSKVLRYRRLMAEGLELALAAQHHRDEAQSVQTLTRRKKRSTEKDQLRCLRRHRCAARPQEAYTGALRLPAVVGLRHPARWPHLALALNAAPSYEVAPCKASTQPVSLATLALLVQSPTLAVKEGQERVSTLPLPHPRGPSRQLQSNTTTITVEVTPVRHPLSEVDQILAEELDHQQQPTIARSTQLCSPYRHHLQGCMSGSTG